MSNLSQDAQNYLKAFESDRTPLGVGEEISILREQRDEAEKALHRLPRPPDAIGDGPDERVGYVLQLLQSARVWSALWKRRAKLTKSQRDFVLSVWVCLARLSKAMQR